MTAQTSPDRDLQARGLADIPFGNAGECFVAHTVLALMSCHLRMAGTADLHIVRALDIIDEQPHRLQTVRVEHDISLVRVLTRAGDMTATLLLPVIGDLVIAPRVDFETILPTLRERRGSDTPVTLCDIDIDNVRVRLRTARLKTALHEIIKIGSIESRVDRITALLNQCLFPSLKAAEPLNMADAFFSLARKFAQLENHALSSLSLQKAEFYIRHYANTTGNEAHQELSQSLTRKIGGLVDRLGALAS
jgi:hypothetical protein